MNNFQFYLQQLRTLTAREICKRSSVILRQKILDMSCRIRTVFFHKAISNETFLRKCFINKRPFESTKEMATYFRERQYPAFMIDSFEQQEKELIFLDQFKEQLVDILSVADKVCNNIFNLLGSGDVNMGKKINWHCDFKTGFCWDPKKYYKDVKRVYGKADIKVPWELSRFHHLTVLGSAYLINHNEKYTRVFMLHVNDWIANNSPKFGVNWNCTMDVAIRACNLIAGYSYFKDSPEITDDFIMKFLKSIYQHGNHIMSNLEYYETLTSNHYLSNIAGLIFLATLFPEFDKAENWKAFAVQELKSEMDKQVYDDGCDFEASTCYHRLVLEFFFYCTLITVINDGKFQGDNYREITERIFGKQYTVKLLKMFQAVLYILKPDGRMPQIGDNDSGRFFIFETPGTEVLNMGYLLSLGAVFFDEPEFKAFDSDDIRMTVFSVFSKKGLEQFDKLEKKGIHEIKSHALPDAGWYVMRNSDDYLIISCGPNGQNHNGGHAHNDKLSFELCLDGKDIFVDPGTYVYTLNPDMRNLFRSTEYHNTVSVKGLEQNKWAKGTIGLFNLYNNARASVLSWENTDDEDRFIGEHYGYEAHGLVHKREITFHKRIGSILINDLLEGDTASTVTAHFHLPPDVEVLPHGDNTFIIQNARIKFHDPTSIELTDYFYSREYGMKEPAKVIKVIFKRTLMTEIEKIK